MKQSPLNATPGFSPTRVLEVELTQGLVDRADMGAHRKALVLVRCYDIPVGWARVDCQAGVLSAAAVRAAITADPDMMWRISQETLKRWLLPPAVPEPEPRWSLIICTRERVENLQRCLDCLCALPIIAGGELIVVDNAPVTAATRELVSRYPAVRYVVEPRQGLNWARTRGALVATGEIVLYTDDDVVIDRCWISAMLKPFQEPRVGAVVGLTVVGELETAAQELFEQYGGHSRGFSPLVFDPAHFSPSGAGQIGSGANMAFRRELIERLRLFACECDMGTVTLTGGDVYAFYLVLNAGFKIMYTPHALIWHYHRRDYASLVRMLYSYSVGGFAGLWRMLFAHRDLGALNIAAYWFKNHHIRELRRAILRRPQTLPMDLLLQEWRGFLVSAFAYRKARAIERARLAAGY